MAGPWFDVIQQKIIDAQARELPRLTHRDVWLPQVPRKAVAVIGMRRAGKTSLLWQVLSERVDAGVPRQGLLYFSFEDERLAGMGQEDLSHVLEAYYRLNPDWRDGRRACLFFDEIQLVPGWERFVRRVLDSENVDLFVSGSSARMLSREVASSMRGRALEAVVTPFSFREALRHAGLEPSRATARHTKATRSRLEGALCDYLRDGGFPEAQGLDVRSRAALLGSYVDVVLLRDVIERHGVAQPQVLRWLVQHLLGNGAGFFSINKFHADLRSRGVTVGKDTLHELLAHLQDAFLVTSVNIATDSVRRRQVNPRKIYPVDTGLSALFARTDSPNLGHALETAVFHALGRQGAEVGYVRTDEGHEVDFLARYPDGRTALVQVCADLTDPTTAQREVRALCEAGEAHPEAERLLIAIEFPTAANWPAGVRVCRAVDWLLDEAGGAEP